MFQDDDCVFSEYRNQSAKHIGQVQHGIRRVEKHHIKAFSCAFNFFQRPAPVGGHDPRSVTVSKGICILYLYCARLSVMIHKAGIFRPAAERLKAQRTASGKKIQHPAAADLALKHIEEVFPNPVQRRPCVPPLRRFDSPASGFPGYNSH